MKVKKNLPQRSLHLNRAKRTSGEQLQCHQLALLIVYSNLFPVFPGSQRLYWSNKKRIEADFKEFCDYYLGYAKAQKAAVGQHPDRLLLIRHEQLYIEPVSQSKRI